MKTWQNAEIVALDIQETAYGGNEHAREANADKPFGNGQKGERPNNGVGGSLNPSSTPVPTETPEDSLS